MKKRIFIGSSSEEKATAEQVQRLLKKDFDVVIWDDNLWDRSVFKLNNNFLHDLMKAPLKFDFGILIGTPDDKVVVRKKTYLQARDNILFELGLFIGRLGLQRTCFLVHKDVKKVSDLDGIFFSRFSADNLEEKVDEIKKFFLQTDPDDFNFFPSNTLAFGYFENFVKAICSKIINDGNLEIEGMNFTTCSFDIIIPNKIDDDINLQFEMIKKKIGVKEAVIKCSGRDRKFHVNIEKLDSGEIKIHDFPTTLTGINYAIKELLPEEFKKNGKEYQNILNRELNKFAHTLQNLIDRNSLSDFVTIVRQ
ncbi:CBASS system CD-NTase-associated NAD(+) hydrolase Cap12 [Chryseobacterium hispalense]|uniref:CBASS system CD-NTase-associated NAD(+) hydrolase Cap12 n=1 Tax=Chryseobacterium hispalense TaxID=1453492 RepID=UPI0004937984|nr:STING domain-containing protein [Chryseobacterium hispalense]